jgi:hypothetical protein
LKQKGKTTYLDEKGSREAANKDRERKPLVEELLRASLSACRRMPVSD